MNQYIEERNEKGFTLIELLVAIVVVGILTAVAIVGIAGLTDKGSTSACNATLDAAKAATAVHFANTNHYPTTFAAMTGTTPPELDKSANVQQTATTLTGTGWTLTMTPGANTLKDAPQYACT